MAPDIRTSLDYLLIADDLTGACDAAGSFAASGRQTLAVLDSSIDCRGIHVLSLSAESRALDPQAIPRLMNDLAHRLPASGAGLLFKKIDSTLRGNAALEIEAVRNAFGCDVALATPAFPRMGRVVEKGRLRVEGQPDFAAIELAAYFRDQGVGGCLHVSPAGVKRALSEAVMVTVDAVCDEDLDMIAAAGLACRRRVLWAGSAGLACALARRMSRGCVVNADRPRPAANRVIFCLGSNHGITLAQQEALLTQRSARLLFAGSTTPSCIASALADCQNIILRVPYGQIAPDQIRHLLFPALECSHALVLSGGDTASLVYRALAMDAIEIQGEIVTGLPHGVVQGGLSDGRSVATKSGGFGAPNALIEVSDFFLCPKT